MSETKPVKAKSEKPTRKEKAQLKSRMSNLLMFLPNLVRLLGRLLTDSRVPTAEKALFAAAIIYVIVPLDFIPDVFPFIGQVDDIYLVALTLLRLINRSDAGVVRDNWSGGGDIVGLADSIAGIAPMLLPKRVSRVLSTNVELADAGKALQNAVKKRQALVAAAEADEDAPKKVKE